MARKKGYKPEEIVAKLRKIEVEAAKGQSIAQACRNAGITDQTYHPRIPLVPTIVSVPSQPGKVKSGGGCPAPANRCRVA